MKQACSNLPYMVESVSIISIHKVFIITIRERPCRITEIRNWTRVVVTVTMRTHNTLFDGGADFHLRQRLTEEVNVAREAQGTIVSIPIFSLSTIQKLFEQRVVRYLDLDHESLSLGSNVDTKTTLWSHTSLRIILPTLLPFFVPQSAIAST